MRDQASITPDPAEPLAIEEDALRALLEQQMEAAKKAQEAAAARVAALGAKLQREVEERVSLRSQVEQRWLKSLRQINGQYEPNVLPEDKDTFGSRVYVPLTRRLRNMVEARMTDILFPSDQRFWTLDPSPVADLAEALTAMKGLPPEAPAPDMPGVSLSDVGKAIKEVQKEAEMRASRMQRVIDDRLAEARFPAKARRAIGDAIDFGTGVIKGPVPTMVRRRVRTMVGGAMVSEVKEEIVQGYEHVPIWHFFPDMSATDVQECESIYEAHPMTKRQLQNLRGQPGFNEFAINQVTSSAPRSDDRTRREDRRQIAGLASAKDDRYMVWEGHCTVSGADLIAADPELGLHGPNGEPPQVDEKEDYAGVVWFCESVVIKAIVRPLDSNFQHIYSVIYFQRDKSSIFGMGMPEEICDQQDSTNSTYRALHDNMALCSGPQIVFDSEIIKPVDKRWDIRPWKLWRKVDPAADVRAAFALINIDSRMQEIGALFDRSKMLMEEIATAPQIAQGTDAPAYQQSATQATILYQASTLWVRRLVRHWDDDVVEPTMGRAVEWEMDYNEDDSIKGDFRPIAKGVAALVELEGMGTRMQTFVQLLGQMEIPPRDQFRIARQFAKSLKLDPDEMLPSEEELESLKGAEQAPDPAAQKLALEQGRLAAEQENNQLDHQSKMRELDVKEQDLQMRGEEYARRERLALLELASKERMTVEQAAQKYGYDWQKLQAELADGERQRQHETQVFNAEAALKMRQGSGI